MVKTNPNFMNGVPELLVLRLLSEREMYGYELVKEIRAVTKESLGFGEGCIYPILHSLEEDGVLASRRRQVNGRSRYYYRLTAAGAPRLEKLAAEWERVRRGIVLAMGGMRERFAGV
ncbi:helix-turn-helix transcriptional regulator [bacterium]|nr:helix-turn-helix transcriptional regulator [bacterium]